MELIQSLRKLREENNDRSETSRLQDVFDEIEAAMASGVKREAIVKTLQAQGFKMTLKSFESAAYRIRKRRGKGQHTNTNIHTIDAQPHPPETTLDTVAPPQANVFVTRNEVSKRQPDQKPAYVSPGEMKRRRADERMKILSDETEINYDEEQE